MRQWLQFSIAVIIAIGLLVSAENLFAAEKISVAEGKLTLTAPEGWQKKKPSSMIVEHEFSIPKAEGDPADGRMTVMGAGGSIEANIDRWIGQFETADGRPLAKDAAKVDKKNISDEDVVIVEMSGTYLDKQGGPFAPGPTTKREKYRMLAGIVATKKLGNYFFKFYGPEKTVEANEDAFVKMLESLEKK